MASRVWPICSSYSRAMPKVFFSRSMDCPSESTAIAMCSTRLIFMTPPVPSSRRSPSTLDDVRGDDARPEREHLGFIHLDRHLQPVMVGLAECFDAGEVLDRRSGSPGPERFIDTEEMTVSVHEHDRLAERDRFALQQRSKVGKTALLRGKLRRDRRELVEDIRLLHDHDGPAPAGPRRREALA